jgi:ADP-heptose:LPS heptosyltransferase
MKLKRVELAWRRMWIAILVRLMRASHGERPDWDARPHRVLFLRHDRAGDMILSTGVMRAIARSHATIALDVLASPANAGILDGASYVHEVVNFDKRRLKHYLATILRLRRARYDAVIDCMVTAPSLTTLLLVWASGARYRIGIAGRGNDAAFNVTVRPEIRSHAHMVDHLAALVPAFGVDTARADVRPMLEETVDDRRRAAEAWERAAAGREGSGPRVLINLLAGTRARLWPDENYVAVIDHLRRREPRARFIVIAAPNEMNRGEHVAAAAGATLVRTPRLRDALGIVATADFVFTPDTSIAHAAAAFDRPCVAMYVAGSVTRWGLYPASPRARSVEHPEPTLTTLGVDRMVVAVDEVWDAAVVSRVG